MLRLAAGAITFYGSKLQTKITEMTQKWKDKRESLAVKDTSNTMAAYG
jgi:hypothetical protein